MSTESVTPITSSCSDATFVYEATLKENLREKVRSKETRTSPYLNPSGDLKEIVTKTFLESLEESQTQFFQLFRQIQERNYTIIANLAKQQNEAIQQLIDMQSPQSNQSQPSNEGKVYSKNKKFANQLAIIQQKQKELINQLGRNFELNKQADQIPNWPLTGLSKYKEAMENQFLIETQMYNFYNSLEALGKESTCIKKELLTSPKYLDEAPSKVKITVENFDNEMRSWRENPFEELAENMMNISEPFWEKMDVTYQKMDYFAKQYTVADLAMDIGYKEVGKHLNYLEKNSKNPEIWKLKEQVKKDLNLLTTRRYKLALDKHLIEAYMVVPRLRSLKNVILAHIKNSYSQRKAWELTLPKKNSSSLMCSSAKTFIDENNRDKFSAFTKKIVEEFNDVNQELADIYKDFKKNFAVPIKVEINHSEPSFSKIPLPPRVYGDEELYFFNSSQAEEIKEAIERMKEIAEEEKKQIWEVLYEEIRLIKKLMLEYTAQVNYIVDICNRGEFSDIAYFDKRRAASYPYTRLHTFKPADPLDVNSLEKLFNEFSESELDQIYSETSYTDISETDSETFSAPQSGQLLSLIPTNKRGKTRKITFENIQEEKSSSTEEMH